jgi:hypothetical protein
MACIILEKLRDDKQKGLGQYVWAPLATSPSLGSGRLPFSPEHVKIEVSLLGVEK